MFAVVHTSYDKRRFTLWLLRREKVDSSPYLMKILQIIVGCSTRGQSGRACPYPTIISSNVS